MSNYDDRSDYTQVVKDKYQCPECGRIITATAWCPARDVYCAALVPWNTRNEGERPSGQPRKVNCNTLMNIKKTIKEGVTK